MFLTLLVVEVVVEVVNTNSINIHAFVLLNLYYHVNCVVSVPVVRNPYPFSYSRYTVTVQAEQDGTGHCVRDKHSIASVVNATILALSTCLAGNSYGKSIAQAIESAEGRLIRVSCFIHLQIQHSLSMRIVLHRCRSQKC